MTAAHDAMIRSRASAAPGSPDFTPERLAELKARAEAASAFPIAPGLWKHIRGLVFAKSLKGGDTHIADVRGWGYLTGNGHGALGLDPEAAIEHQRALGEHIASASPANVLALIAALEAAWAERDAARDDQVKHMVSRFLGWRLPADFHPDAGISFKAEFNENTPWPMKHEPTGTNLFDATQAAAMVRHMIDGFEGEAINWKGEWEATSSLRIADAAQIARLQAELAEAREGLRHIKNLSCPTVRIEEPRHNLDKVWDIADEILRPNTSADTAESLEAQNATSGEGG